jgi:hypothetical protein
MLLSAEARPSLWAEAVKCDAYLLNLCPKAGRKCTPFEEFHGHVPVIYHLRTWGCLCYVHTEKHQTTALGPKAAAGILLGYEPQSPISYRVLQAARKVVTSRKVTFIEGTLGSLYVSLLERGTAAEDVFEEDMSALDPSFHAETCPDS